MRFLLSIVLLSAACATDTLPSDGAVDLSAPPVEFPEQMVLESGEMLAGQDFTVTASGATPGDRVFFGYSLNGLGTSPALSALGGLSLDLAAPPALAPGANPAVANADGIATITFRLPPTVPDGFQAGMQAAVAAGAGSYLSNPILVEVAGCAEDANEDDDDAATAHGVDFGELWQGRACGGDDDWYAIDVLAGNELTVDMRFIDADGDLDVYLYDGVPADIDNDWVERGFSGTDNELVTLPVVSSTTIYVRVNRFSDGGNGPGNNYDITWSQLDLPIPYPGVTYQLKSVLGGDDRCLEGNDPAPTSTASGSAFMADCGPFTGQFWTFEPDTVVPGNFQMKTDFQGPTMCLESNDPNNPAADHDGGAFMTPCGNFTGQSWSITPNFGNYEFRSEFLGDTMCLESNDFPLGDRGGISFMTPCGNFTGQLWNLEIRQ